MSPPVVELRDVFRVHRTDEGDAAALQGLSLDVVPGEVLAVVGPSGSGKTSLLRLLAGLDRPSAGAVRVLGHDLDRLPAREVAAFRSTHLGYADQSYRRVLAPELTALELVSLPLLVRGAPRPAAQARARELLRRVGLGDRGDSQPGELSGGERQRVAVCAAVAHKPQLVLADEPTGELDAENAAHVFAAIGELVHEEGATAVVVSHDPRVSAIADRVAHLRDGRFAAEDAGGGEEAVVSEDGWVRLPQAVRSAAAIGSRAHVTSDGSTAVLRATARTDPATGARPQIEPAGAGEVVAEVHGLVKEYRTGASTRTVLDRLDLAFRSGRVTAVTGPSGSGKTTLLHLLAGLVLPTDGDVSVDGVDVEQLDRAGRAELRAARVGIVEQDTGLVPFLSALENVALALDVQRVPRAEAVGRAEAALDHVGLASRAHQRVARLSTGERGRVALARAVVKRPALLLADEPTSRLDRANAEIAARLLVELARSSGAAVVCATHDPIVFELADDRVELG
jgi:ABC-type lipoprotein export system ATPase subunit